jgi:hypothetical protein
VAVDEEEPEDVEANMNDPGKSRRVREIEPITVNTSDHIPTSTATVSFHLLFQLA